MNPVEPIEKSALKGESGATSGATAAAVPQSGGPARMKFSMPERICFAVLLVIFTAFTWRGLLMYYSSDDMMNTYWAWTWDHRDVGWANLLVWMPVYRPLGEIILLAFYAMFGFQPVPLYIFCWLLLLANVFAAYTLFRTMFSAAMEAFIALALILVHGEYIDLYGSAGMIFDRLVFFFTVAGMAFYIRTRQSGPTISFARGAVLWLLCVLAMDSKESGVALPALFAGYESIFVLPQVWREKNLRRWMRSIGPLYLILAATCLAFVFGRVFRTWVLVNTPGYHPKIRASYWLQNVAHYASLLTYERVTFSVTGTVIVLVAMVLVAIGLRSRILAFGLWWFFLTVTPVALITPRQGYVLYVPAVGLGLYFAELIATASKAIASLAYFRASVVSYLTFAVVTAATTWGHAKNWRAFPDVRSSSELALTSQFHNEYPSLRRGARLLFVSDYFPKDSWGLTFTLRLFYRDRALDVKRLGAMPDQQPKADESRDFDHVFATAAGRYEELDNRNTEESIRLHILRRYSVGRATVFNHRDHGAYVVSGIQDFDGSDEGRWTDPKATLKFDVYPVDSALSLRFWVADVVAAPPAKTLTIRVNGQVVGSDSLTHSGFHTVSVPVKAAQITRSGFTLVELAVDKPYKGADGVELGVILMDAGFEYAGSR